MENGSPPKRRRLIKSPQRPSPLRRPLHRIAEQRSKATRSSTAKTDEKSKAKPPASSKALSAKSKGAKPTKTKSPPHPEPEKPSSSKAKTETAHQNSLIQNETSENQNETAPQNETVESPQSPATSSQALSSAESEKSKTPVPEVGHMCEEHVSCRPVTWKTMSDKLKKVCRVISGLASTVQKYDNVQGFNWVEGEYLLHDLLKHPESWDEECSVCAGLEFMYRDWDFYYLCLEGVRISWGIDGNESVEEVQDWMEGLLAYQA